MPELVEPATSFNPLVVNHKIQLFSKDARYLVSVRPETGSKALEPTQLADADASIPILHYIDVFYGMG